MADHKLIPFHLPASLQKRKIQPQSEVKQIARETLEIVNQCAKALHAYHAETEITLGHVCGLLDALELLAVRALVGGAR